MLVKFLVKFCQVGFAVLGTAFKPSPKPTITSHFQWFIYFISWYNPKLSERWCKRSRQTSLPSQPPTTVYQFWRKVEVCTVWIVREMPSGPQTRVKSPPALRNVTCEIAKQEFVTQMQNNCRVAYCCAVHKPIPLRKAAGIRRSLGFHQSIIYTMCRLEIFISNVVTSWWWWYSGYT